MIIFTCSWLITISCDCLSNWQISTILELAIHFQYKHFEFTLHGGLLQRVVTVYDISLLTGKIVNNSFSGYLLEDNIYKALTVDNILQNILHCYKIYYVQKNEIDISLFIYLFIFENSRDFLALCIKLLDLKESEL